MTDTKQKPAEADLTKGFEYLDELRASGRTNMFGAIAYMDAEIEDWDTDLSQPVWSKWIKTFDGTTPLEDRVKKALAL